MNVWQILLIFAGLLVHSSHQQSTTRLVCYMTNWSQYRNGAGKFFPENVDPSLCTHLIYAFGNLVNNQIVAYEWNDENTDWSKGLYERTMSLKQKNPNLKIMLAIGGWNMATVPFSAIVASDASMNTFVNQAISFLKARKFDGLDLDWEYPANRGSPPQDKHRFSVLCAKLSQAFKPQGLLLSAALGAGKATIDSAYEIDQISQSLDFLNLMSYDLHGSWESTTGMNSPLYAREDDADQTLNIDWAAKQMIEKGCLKSKLNVGLATYGRSFKLQNPASNGIGAPASGAGQQGPFTSESGFMSYYEICQKLSSGWSERYDEDSVSAYAFQGDQWISYDDVTSLTTKAKYILEQGYGGAMFWTLDLDDFTGQFCGQGKYPLIRSVKAVINGRSPPPAPVQPQPTNAPKTRPTTAPTPTTPTTATPKQSDNGMSSTTTEPSPSSSNDKCPNGDGYYPDVEKSCRMYFRCINTGTANHNVYKLHCPDGLIFDKNINVCNYPETVDCS